MTSFPELPDPWRAIEILSQDDQSALEAVVGSRLTYQDLTEDDYEDRGEIKIPRSRRSTYVTLHRWIKLQNVDTDVEVLIRLQGDQDGTRRVSSVVFPFEPARELNGSDLRSLPVAAIGAIFTAHEQAGNASVQRMLALYGDDAPGALEPLPRANASDRFSALVARQYVALEDGDPGKNVAKLMSELNGVPLSSIQRWIARSRKAGFLSPAVPRGSRG